MILCYDKPKNLEEEDCVRLRKKKGVILSEPVGEKIGEVGKCKKKLSKGGGEVPLIWNCRNWKNKGRPFPV